MFHLESLKHIEALKKLCKRKLEKNKLEISIESKKRIKYIPIYLVYRHILTTYYVPYALVKSSEPRGEDDIWTDFLLSLLG